MEPAWARVAQTHPKVASGTKIVAVDSGVNLAHDMTSDGTRSARGSSRSGILPSNHRRNRKPRGYDDGRRRKQAPRRGRASWGSGDRNLWPANMLGLPLLYDDRMSYWSLQPTCDGFSQPALMIDTDWSLPESYKERFSDLASSQWTRPSFEEETVSIVEGSVGLLPCSSQDSADAQCAEHASDVTSPVCRNTLGIGNDCASVPGSARSQPLLTGVSGGDNVDTTESGESQNLVSVDSEQLVVAERLPDDVGNLLLPHDIHLSILQDGGFGMTPNTNSHLTGIDIKIDDDPFLGCRPFDPALWSVLNSARMWYGYSSLARELHLVPNSSECSELYDIGLHLFGVDSSPYDWNDMGSVLDGSGCFDVSDNFSLLSLQDGNAKTPEVSQNSDDQAAGKVPVMNSVSRLTCTETAGNMEAWDGSRIVEAVLENDAVVTVLGAEALQQIWQPASCSSVDETGLSRCEEYSDAGNTICRHHLQRCSADDRISAVDAKVDGHCKSKFRCWTDKCHCVSCIWQCELLSGDFSQSQSWTDSSIRHESNPPTEEVNREGITSPLASSASDSSTLWSEFHHDRGNILKASSTWDSQLFSSDCLEPLSQDHTSSSDELKNNENGADEKLLASSTVGNGDGSSGNLLAKKTSLQFSLLRGRESLDDVIEDFAFYNLKHNDSGLDPNDDSDNEQRQMEDLPCIADDDSKIDGSSTKAGETRKFFNLPVTEVELNKSTTAGADGSSVALITVALSSGCDTCSSCRPVSSVVTDLLEENNNVSSSISEAAVVACCDDCEEIVQLLPSLPASVSDIIFSDTDDSLDSELASSDASVFSSPEPGRDELVSSGSVSGLASPAVLDSSSDHVFHSDLQSDDLCSTAQCYVGSCLAPVYTLDGSSLWFRDSHYISANVDALSRLHSDWQPSAGRSPSSVAHESVCTAMAQCRRLLPSENTAFRDDIPQRLEPLVHFESEPSFCIPTLANNIVQQSSGCALSPFLWPASVDDSLSLKVMPNSNQFRPIGTPSTTDSELSDVSTSTAEAVTTTTDSLTDFASLVMSDMLAGSHDTYQRFVISHEDETEADSSAAEYRTFRPSFKVQYELEKAAQTGEPSPTVSVATDVDLRLGCLVKQVLSQLSGEFPEASSNVDDILCDAGDVSNDASCHDEQKVDEAGMTMSRQLSGIWNDTIDPGGLCLSSSPLTTSDLSAVSCKVSQIWTHSVTASTDTSSPSFATMHGRQLSDIWSDTSAQLADSAYVSDTAELLPSGVPDIWKDAGQQTRSKTNKLRRMWKSVDSDDVLAVSDGGLFKSQSIWSNSRPSSVIAEAETLRPVLEDADLVTCASVWKSSGMDESSDECDVSPSELDIFWGLTSDLKSPTTGADVDTETCAEEDIFHVGGLRNGLLSNDDIWSPNETGICRAECGEADVERSWNVDPLYCSGNTTAALISVTGDDTVDPHSVADPLPLWTSSDADVAFAFTHLVSEVVSNKLQHVFSSFSLAMYSHSFSLAKFRFSL